MQQNGAIFSVMFEDASESGRKRGILFLQEFDGKELNENLHEHAGFELVYLHRGRGSWQIGARSGSFSRPALWLYPPGTLHRFQSELGASGAGLASGLVVRFSRAALPKGLLGLNEMSRLKALKKAMATPLMFEVSDAERVRARLRSIDRAQGALRLARFYVALELLAPLRYTQLTEAEEDASRGAAREEARAAAVKRFLSQRFREPIRRSEAARAAGMEAAAFSRFFRRAVGTTFSDYLANARTREAATLLGSRRDLSVPEVARRSGFRNLSAFHRQFKKRLGTTPEAYRKAANREALEP